MKSLFRVCLLLVAIVSVLVWLALVWTVSDLPETARPQVTPADFEILSCNSHWSWIDMLHVAGEVRNNGTVGAIAEIELIARDANGTLVDTATIWPATKNILPGETRAFKYPLTQDKRAVAVSARIMRVAIRD